MTPEWLEQNAKIAEAEGFLELAEGFRERKRNWHTWVTGNWSEVGGSQHSVQETADKLTASYIEQRGAVPRHVLRKLTLDLLCASFPKGYPPPAALVRLMKCALELPESHEVGSWPTIAG